MEHYQFTKAPPRLDKEGITHNLRQGLILFRHYFISFMLLYILIGHPPKLF